MNIIIKLVIGISAVLAMVMIVVGGVEYMSSGLISSKEEGTSRMTNAILGLLIALGSYLILNTLNPQLLSVCLDKLPEATVTIIKDFEISGALSPTFNGQPIKVNFNQTAYPAAKIAYEKTGVSTSLILAIFAQETTSGTRSTGRCNYATANMGSGQLEYLKKVVNSLNTAYPDLNLDFQTVNMSCSGSGSSNGGAIGFTQFLPGTWWQYKDAAKQYLGHEPNPWNAADALMMEAVFLKNLGAVSNQKEAACKYFGGPGNSCSSSAAINDYGNMVMGKKLSIEQQINEAIKKGEIQP